MRQGPVPILIEAAVDGAAAAAAAVAAGAGRLELCGDLGVGGVTPPEALLDGCAARWGVPVAVMVRPRGGDFTYDAADRAALLADARRVARERPAALVTGALGPDGMPDLALVRAVQDAAGLPVVFHRAVDHAADADRAIDRLAEGGIARVLTSGAAPTAWEGRETLARWRRLAAGRLEILPGGGVRAPHARALVAATGVGALHADGRDPTVIAALVAAVAAGSGDAVPPGAPTGDIPPS